MEAAIQQEFKGTGEKVLTITGVRLGESAIRDGRISMACSKNGAECGQGWYQNTLSENATATLAPIMHWRVCNVWDWLKYFAPQEKYGGWDTTMLAQAYGGDKAKEKNARTGCVGCPLANQDSALDAVLQQFPQEWGHLRPLKRLRPIYREMRRFNHRLRKHGETNANGEYSSNPNRVGPLTIEARKKFYSAICEVQEEVNRLAPEGKQIDILNAEEKARIRWHWENNIWPDRWNGDEPLATDPYEKITGNTIQLNIFS